jgi:1-deoxy-D-xylulose-5-phosphate reductoisomerase
MRYISPPPDAAWQRQRPRTLTILGSTGSIGCSALEVVRLSPGDFDVAALAGARNIPLLAAQAAEFRPEHLGVLEQRDVDRLRTLLPRGYRPVILAGQHGYETLARLPGVGTVLSAQTGAAGLRATIAAAEAGKVIALANKESLVLAGEIIRKTCRQSGASILPVDSEHNAIFQCLAGSIAYASRQQSDKNLTTAQPSISSEPVNGKIARLVLTASGGPFFGKGCAELAQVTPDEALAHPRWSMGEKISIDSSTFMNKGLELIEAHHLYGLPLEAIDVLVHKESIIHSLVEFADGSQLAQLAQPDMRIPIANCLGWPRRIPTGVPRLDLASLGSLTFDRPDEETFPCLGLARKAQERGHGCPVVLNAANEEAVGAFLDRRIGFLDIAAVVGSSLTAYTRGEWAPFPPYGEPESMEAILALDAQARLCARSAIDECACRNTSRGAQQ